MPLCIEHGAALIALTIDEESMAKTRQRKLDVAKRIHGYVCDEYGMDPQLLIFDALTFTLATGSDEFKTRRSRRSRGSARSRRRCPAC